MNVFLLDTHALYWHVLRGPVKEQSEAGSMHRSGWQSRLDLKD